MRARLSPDVNQEMILIICGYSFGDSHVNQEIKNALYKSSGRLTLLAFVNTDYPGDILKSWVEDPRIKEQIQIYANKCYIHGDDKKEFKNDLDWWKFEIITKLLGGEQ
jgi:hypothetical protein